MVLRCSLLGHDFGDTEIEREREERGSEVVVTITEYEECARCGETNVVTENTEVTSLDTRTADADEPAEPPEPTDEPPEPADPDLPGDAADEPADVVEAADAGGLEESTDEEPDHPVDEPAVDEEITDDAEILVDDDEEPEPDRERGEWPDSDDVGPPEGAENEPAAWPEDDPVDEAPTEPDPGRSEPVETVAAPEGGETATAEASSAESGRSSPGADRDSGAGTGIASARPAPSPGEADRADDVRTEFFCPRCDFVAPDDRGSLRSGDICPDCRKGYLSERER